MTPARDFPDRPFIGVGGVIWHAGQVLLVQRNRPPRVGEWSIPGGAQELGETVAAALRREVLEETGLVIGTPRLLDVIDFIERSTDGRVRFHYTLIDFDADADHPDCRPRDDVCAVTWVSPRDLDERPMWDRTKAVIRKSLQRRESAHRAPSRS